MPREKRAARVESGAETVRDLRRAQIVRAARAIVAESGIEALTFAELEKRLSFTRGVITYHFTDKNEIEHALLESAVREIDEGALRALQATTSVEEKLRTVVRANVRGFVDRPEAGRVLLSFWARLSSDARIARTNAGLYARYRKHTRKLLDAGVRDGELAAIDVDAAATCIVGVVLGIATQWYFDPKAIDVDAAIEVACEMVLARLAHETPRKKGRFVARG